MQEEKEKAVGDMSVQELVKVFVRHRKAEQKLRECPMDYNERQKQAAPHKAAAENAKNELQARYDSAFNNLQDNAYLAADMNIMFANVPEENVVARRYMGRGVDPLMRITLLHPTRNSHTRNTLSEIDSLRLIDWAKKIEPQLKDAIDLGRKLASLDSLVRGY